MQSTMKKVPLLALAAAAASTGALAQSLPEGVTARGTIELEYVHSTGGFDEQVAYGDLDLSYRTPDGAGALGFGFDLGLTALATTGGRDSAIYAAAVLTTLWGDYSIGIPRTAFDQQINLPPVVGSRLIDAEFAIGGGSRDFLSSAYLFGSSHIYGLRYDGSFGALGLSASLHDSEDLDGYTFQLAGTYGLGNGATLLAGYERVDTSGAGTLQSLLLGATLDRNRLDGGLILGHTSAPFGDTSLARGYIGYDVTQQLNLRGELLYRDGTSSQTFYGVGAEFTLPGSGAYIQGGVLDTDSADPILDASLGFRF